MIYYHYHSSLCHIAYIWSSYELLTNIVKTSHFEYPIPSVATEIFRTQLSSVQSPESTCTAIAPTTSITVFCTSPFTLYRTSSASSTENMQTSLLTRSFTMPQTSTKNSGASSVYDIHHNDTILMELSVKALSLVSVK